MKVIAVVSSHPQHTLHTLSVCTDLTTYIRNLTKHTTYKCMLTCFLTDDKNSLRTLSARGQIAMSPLVLRNDCFSFVADESVILECKLIGYL